MPLPDGAEEEFDDERRLRLLDELERRIGRTLPPVVSALLWLTDVDNIEALTRISDSKGTGVVSNAELLRGYLENFETRRRAIQKCRLISLHMPSRTPLRLYIHTGLQRDRKGPLAPTPASSRRGELSLSLPSTPKLAGKRKLDINMDVQVRSTFAKFSCQSRDNSQCIITKDREIEVAHIYPFTLRGHHQYGDPGPDPDKKTIWDSLSVFWSKERVESWHNAVFPEGKYADACYNFLCLSPSAHRYFCKGYFALKPISISDDQRCMVVKFFWLHKRPSDKIFVNFRDTPSIEGQDQGYGYSRLFDHETTSVIRSGDELRLETEDPQTRPLPRWEILEMQWFMNRVVAISGATGAEDDYRNDDDDDDDDDHYEDGMIPSYEEQDFDLLDEWDSLGERQ